MGSPKTRTGRALGLTFQQIQKYEKGSNRISASTLWDIANVFKVDAGYFYAVPSRDEGDLIEIASNDLPATRHSVEIKRLASRLSPRQQKLALELIRAMAAPPGSDED